MQGKENESNPLAISKMLNLVLITPIASAENVHQKSEVGCVRGLC